MAAAVTAGRDASVAVLREAGRSRSSPREATIGATFTHVDTERVAATGATEAKSWTRRGDHHNAGTGADGFGVQVVVECGALEVHDGVGPQRRSRRCHPGHS